MAAGRKFRIPEVNLVNRAAKQRQAEDRLRADAWRKQREAELEAVVNRSYDGSEVPEIMALVDKFREVAAPFVAEFARLAKEHYPAEFARPSLSWGVRAGGLPDDMRDKVRRDAAKHLSAKHANMLANSADYTIGVITDASMRATDNPGVVEMLEKLRVPNRTTPVLESPGPAIGILAKLLPYPEEWGLAGYVDTASPLLTGRKTVALPPPEGSDE
jgi:hypothetical protein